LVKLTVAVINSTKRVR